MIATKIPRNCNSPFDFIPPNSPNKLAKIGTGVITRDNQNKIVAVCYLPLLRKVKINRAAAEVKSLKLVKIVKISIVDHQKGACDFIIRLLDLPEVSIFSTRPEKNPRRGNCAFVDFNANLLT